MEYYNQEHSTNIELLGWDSATGVGLFTGDFVDQAKGKAFTEDLFDQGADIFMPVGGLIGVQGFDVARDRGGYGIWVDLDGYDILPGARDVMLTSVLKNLDNTTYGLIKETIDGNFNGCDVYLGDVANSGVGIAPYHDLDSAVPAALKSEIEVLKAKIASGVITDTGCVSYPEHCPAGLY
jgi:basic membrane protein A